MCVGSPCVGGSPHPPARIMSTQLFSPDTSVPSISNYHTPQEPIREAWGSAFRIQACLVAQLCHRSQQWLTGQSPPCHSCHCSLPGPSGPHIPPWRSLHLWLPYLHRLGTQGRGGGHSFQPPSLCQVFPSAHPSPSTPAPHHPEKAPFRVCGTESPEPSASLSPGPGMAPHRCPDCTGVAGEAEGWAGGDDSPVAEEAALNDLQDKICSLSLSHVGAEPISGEEFTSGPLSPESLPPDYPLRGMCSCPCQQASVRICSAEGKAQECSLMGTVL